MNPDKYQWRSKEVDAFWRFVYERHSIWHKRFILHQAPPWTDDPILQRIKFTNIYRELDPGTMYSIYEIMNKPFPAADRIFNVMMYRLMVKISTYDSWGFHTLAQFNEEEFDEHLRQIYNTGEPVFGNAYLISPYSSMGSEYKFRNVSRLFGLIHRNFGWFYDRLVEAQTLQKAFQVINAQYGFGPFLAYQVCVDLMYPLPWHKGRSILKFSPDDWVKLGPGAKRGFSRVSPSHDQAGGLRALRFAQKEEFERLGLDFPYLHDKEGNPQEINLANMQNCFCEFHKYRSMQDGTGKSQRLYIPGDR